MALDDIKKAIEEEANRSAQAIISEAENKAAEIEAQWNKKLEQKKAELLKLVQLKADKKIQQSQFKLQSQNQSIMLQEKQKMIDKVYKTALQKLKDISDDKYVSLMEKFVSDIKIDGELISANGKESLLKKSIKKSSASLTVSKDTVNADGGFIFRSPSMEIDFTFETLISKSKDRSILEVSGILFNEQE